MMLRRALLAGAALLAALHSAKADFTFTPGTGATAFSFTSTTGGTALCAAASTHCFASVPINTAGVQLFTSGVPGVINATQWASTALGAPSNFGTSPGAVIVPGVNAALPSVTGSKAAGTAAANSLLIGCVRNIGGVTPADTQQVGVQCGPNGEVIVSGTGVGKAVAYSAQTGSVVMGLINTAAPTGGADGNLDFVSLTTRRGQRSDIDSIGGTAVDTNSGNKSAGTQRNVLATDQLALAAWGQGANGATAPTSSTQEGCRGASTAPTEVTDGQMTPIQCGLGGKQIVMPFTVKELAVRGTATSTDTSAHTVIASAGGSLKNYITGAQCYNTSATSVVITFNDSVTTPLYLPAGGGNNATYNVPLVTPAATAFQFTSPSGLTTIGCAAQGFIGP